ncbi:MAG: abortive infection protein [Bacillales bacterium]|jgi:membrane protease YdiL (CAAX protease family)|nr:abortive infection protein [Bacillales bacterium]
MSTAADIIITKRRKRLLKLKRNIVIYMLVTFGVTWLIWFPLLANHSLGMNLPIIPGQFYLASFGPLIGAVVSSATTSGWKGTKDWGKRVFSFDFSLRLLTVVGILLLVYFLVSITVHAIVLGNWPEWIRFGITEKLPGLNIWQTSLVWILTFGLGEESGWRGYMIPELYKRYSLLKSSLITAGVWIVWHLPAFWFNPNYMEMGWGVLGWAISLAYGSVLLAWICRSSKWSIIPVILWHGGFDLLTASDQAGEVMAMVCSMLVIIHGVVLSRRLSKEELPNKNIFY